MPAVAGAGVEEEASLAEILAIIDESLDLDLRAAYLQMRAGQFAPKARRLEVENEDLRLEGSVHIRQETQD